MFLTTFALPAMSSLTLMKVASCGRASCFARTATLKSAPRIVKSVVSKGSGGADRPLGCAQSNYDVLKRSPEISRINVLPLMYNRTMKKNKKPLNKANEARRKAHSAELFRSLMLSPHLVETPATRKGSRQSNKRKAIAEHQ